MTEPNGPTPPDAVVVVGACAGGCRASTTAVALVASAGGLVAISRVLSGLPYNLAAAVLVVLHLLPEHRSVLAEILRRNTDLRVKTAENGDLIEPGCVYVAPPDVHLQVERGGRLRLDVGPPVHHVRPSADILFDSMAEAYDGACLAVVLSGTGEDGASGAKALKASGGRVLVQDPASSEHGGMPAAAIAAGAADGVISLEEIAPAIRAFVAEVQQT